jgi:hypothetical protein
MGQAERAEGPVVSDPRTPEEIRADIADTREEVGDTVEALAAKTDVKAQVRQRIDTVKAKVQSSTPASAQQGGQQVATKVRENPAPVVVGGAVLVAFLLGRRSVRP